MATFKVGQRVRKLCMAPPQFKWRPVHHPGSEGTVIDVTVKGSLWWREVVYIVSYDRDPMYPASAVAHMLAPLTDPKADAFLASLKKPVYEEPKVVKEKA